MPILSWVCAHGDAPAVTLSCAATVTIAPADDSVDTNNVVIEGMGSISSFGACPYTVSKWVNFKPLGPPAPPPSITLVNSPVLNCLGKTNRTITADSYGIYQCDGLGNWTEIYFTATGTVSLEFRVNALEERLAALERTLKHSA